MVVERLEHKLGIRASDTATILFNDCRVPAANLLGSPEVDAEAGLRRRHADLRQHPPAGRRDGGRLCAGRAGRDPRTCSTEAGVDVDYDRPAQNQRAAAATLLQMEADWEAAHLLMLEAAWMADNRKANSLEASMAKAKAGRSATDITLRCVELAGSIGYSEGELLEKWARDSKILDIFEGTQQIQQLIVARRVLGKSSTELK